MKKIMSVVVMLCLVSNTAFSGQSNSQMIAKTFNEFRYQMTVVNDPSNPNFKEEAAANFKQRMADLQKQGVTADEIMNHMRESILDANVRADFDRLLENIHSSKMNSEEAANVAMQFMASKYQQGTSYSGGGSAGSRWVGVLIGVLIIGVVTFLVIRERQNQERTDTSTTTFTNTTTETQTDTDTDTDTCTETWTQTATAE